MNKTEIRVTIDSIEKQQKAIEILERNGQNIWKDKTAMLFNEDEQSLIFFKLDGDWLIVNNYEEKNKTEITLQQLDELLINNKQIKSK